MSFRPPACLVDDNGAAIKNLDCDWTVKDVTGACIVLESEIGHIVTLGLDHVNNYSSNPQRSDRHGFLVLGVQVFVQDDRAWYAPTRRPGEPLKPEEVTIEEKWVDFKYPDDRGIAKELQDQGYRVSWCQERFLPRRLELEGCEVVILKDEHERPYKLRLKDKPEDQTLVKKRER